MGIIYNRNVEEKELYSAYGMTVYGKENDYDWAIYPDRSREKCYISLRINDGKNDIINMVLGNRCIFKENFDRTIDNFLYWIEKDIITLLRRYVLTILEEASIGYTLKDYENPSNEEERILLTLRKKREPRDFEKKEQLQKLLSEKGLKELASL